MPELTFVTGNAEKFYVAEQTFKTHGIELKQGTMPIDEIQEEDTERIAYQDESDQKIFTLEYTGEILPEARGSYGSGLQKSSPCLTTTASVLPKHTTATSPPLTARSPKAG